MNRLDIRLRVIIYVFVVLFAVFGMKGNRLVATFIPPTLDGSSDQAFIASVKAMAATLTTKERETLKRTITDMGGRIMETPAVGEDAGLTMKQRLYKHLGGKTYPEIILENDRIMVAYADYKLTEARARLDRLKAAEASATTIAAAQQEVDDYAYKKRWFLSKMQQKGS